MRASSSAVLGLFLFACASAPAGEDDRARFLARVDAALTSRDRDSLEGLADLAAWGAREERLELLLPPAPIRREKVLSETEVLYRDGERKSWRLVTRRVGDALCIVPRARPCPEGGQRRRLVDGALAPNLERPSTWTPLECWPLPK